MTKGFYKCHILSFCYYKQQEKIIFLDCSGLFCGQQNCSNFFPETFLLEEKKLTLTLTATLQKNFSNSPEKFFQRVGKIFPESLLIFQDFSMFKFFFPIFFLFFLDLEKNVLILQKVQTIQKNILLILLFWLYTLRRNSFSCNFDFSKLPRMKKGHIVNIPKPRPSASASKIFYSLSFFQPW